MQFVHVLENNIAVYLLFKAISRFQSSYSNQQQPPLLIEDMQCSPKQSLAVGACNDWVFLCQF